MIPYPFFNFQTIDHVYMINDIDKIITKCYHDNRGSKK